MIKKHDNINSRSNLFCFFVITLFSFIILFICTSSSPRYAINPWDDSNAFFTVGKAMANGIIPYKDIFEQKGPLLYFIHLLSYLFSKTSFFGVYILESISATITIFYTYKIASLYLSKIASLVASCLTFTFICNSYCFYLGDSAEEFSMPFMAFGLYYLISYFKKTDNFELKWYHFFINGFFAGCIAMIKFTLIGFWFAWMASIAIYILIVKKDIKNAVKNSVVFLSGMFSAFIPWIIYFFIHGALKDFIYVYFIVNATAYANQNSFITKCLDIIYFYRIQFSCHPLTVSATIISAFLPVAFKFFGDGKLYSRFVVPFIYCCCVFFIYFGGVSLTYYFLPLTIFVLFGLITVLYCFEHILFKKPNNYLKSTISAVLLISVVVISCFTNVSSRTTTKKWCKTYQSEIAEYIISHNPNGKVLNYGVLDLGVYLPMNYTDLFKHFEAQNISVEKFPDNLNSQNDYINTHQAFYVVTSTTPNISIDTIYKANPKLLSDYNLVLETDTDIVSQRDSHKINRNKIYLFELKR